MMKKITFLCCVWAMLFPFIGGYAQEPQYCELKYNGSSGSTTTGNNRSFSTIDLSDGAGHSKTINVNASGSRNIYLDFLSTSFETEPGQTIHFKTTGNGEWMQTYVYIDWGYDGFSDDDEVFNNYKGESFHNYFSQDFDVTVPEAQAPGNYRVRYMITWDNDGPCNIGQSSKDNGDLCVDFIITIPGEASEPVLAATLTSVENQSLTLNVATAETSTVYVDWGDGNKVPFQGVSDSLAAFPSSELVIKTTTAITGTPTGTVKVYADNLLCFLAAKQPVETIEFPAASRLVWLDLATTSISELNTQNLPNLKVLKVNETKMSSVDVTTQPKLLQLFAGDLGLTEIDVTHNTKLSTLNVSKNNLTTIDVSKCDTLANLVITYNQFEKAADIQFPATPRITTLTRVQLNNNNFKMSTLPVLDNIPYKAMTYAPQADYALSDEVSVGEQVDLSSEATVQETATVYTWKTSDGTALKEGTHYQVVSPGVFTFTSAAAGLTVLCEMANDALKDFKTTKAYKTTQVTIAADPTGIAAAQAEAAVYAVAGKGSVQVMNLEPGSDVALYNVGGALIASQKATAGVQEFAVVPGLYIVKAGTFRQIVAVP